MPKRKPWGEALRTADARRLDAQTIQTGVVNEYPQESWWTDHASFYARAKQELMRMQLRSPFGRGVAGWKNGGDFR